MVTVDKNLIRQWYLLHSIQQYLHIVKPNLGIANAIPILMTQNLFRKYNLKHAKIYFPISNRNIEDDDKK